MKKVGIITFHASHNYGSVLQAYALSNKIKEMGFDCEIINYRSPAQIEKYKPLTKRKGLKYVFKNLYFFLTLKKRQKKYDLFEDFIANTLLKSQKEYREVEELYDMPRYDYYISGSDQIWNTACQDASLAYFLPFAKKWKETTGSKIISYAASLGTTGCTKMTDEIVACLNDYDYVSVRESAAREYLGEIVGKMPQITLDPTMLLSKDKWEEMAGDTPIIQGEYIFFYTLFATKEMIRKVKEISKLTGLKVVISNITNKYEIFSNFQKETWAGPKEFLNFIKFATLNVMTSFHGTVFSILMHKRFFTINRQDDERISTLLKTAKLEERNVQFTDDIKSILENETEIDYAKVDDLIETQKEPTLKFLRQALDLE